MIQKLVLKAVKDGTNLEQEHLDQIEEQLEGLPQLPTVLVTVKDGIADFQFVPVDQPRTVNIIMVDADTIEIGEAVVVTRSDAGDIK